MSRVAVEVGNPWVIEETKLINKQLIEHEQSSNDVDGESLFDKELFYNL